MAGALDQTSQHLTLLRASPIVLVTVAIAGAGACAHTRTLLEHKHRLLQKLYRTSKNLETRFLIHFNIYEPVADIQESADGPLVQCDQNRFLDQGWSYVLCL